jgi:hypothetical protein
LYDKVMSKLMDVISTNRGLSFTIDMWTSTNSTQSYMSLTAHWITTDFQRKSGVLHCALFNERHTGVNIGHSFQNMLSNWSLQESCCHLVIHDNGANISKAFRDINVPHTSCFAHTLQLVIHDGLLGKRFVDDLLFDCRKIVGHFKQSSSATVELHKLQKQLQLPHAQLVQDVKTRWNSTFYMLERLLEQRKVIALYCSDKESPSNLTHHQWTVAENVCNLLRPFEKLTKDFSSSIATLSMVIPAVRAINVLLVQSDEDEASEASEIGVKTMKGDLIQSLKRRFTDVEDQSVYALSTLLDPRFKIACFNSQNAAAKAKCDLLDQLKLSDCHTPLHSPISIEPPSKKQRLSDQNPWSCLESLMHSQICAVPTNSHTEVEAELSQYLQQALLPRTQDPIEWWKANSSQFPNLSKIAGKYLSAPPTSVPSERVFSAAGDVLSDHRSRLLPERAETLIFLKMNMTFLD